MNRKNQAEKIEGTFTALVTPFSEGAIDMEAFSKLLAIQKNAEVDGIVVCGCTGEAATLDREERAALIKKAIEVSAGKMLVIAGTGTNSTETTIELTQEAEALGADAAMLITPYYNKPTQSGLLQHFQTVSGTTRIPLILYNVPSRTGINITPATVGKLFDTGRFSAIKEAGGSVDTVSDLRSLEGVTVLSGDDSLTLPMIAVGAAGVISVVANIFPSAVLKMVSSALEGDILAARALHYRLLPVVRAAFIETNPSPIKAMLAHRGYIREGLRAPLVPVSKENRKKICNTVDHFLSAWGADK